MDDELARHGGVDEVKVLALGMEHDGKHLLLKDEGNDHEQERDYHATDNHAPQFVEMFPEGQASSFSPSAGTLSLVSAGFSSSMLRGLFMPSLKAFTP